MDVPNRLGYVAVDRVSLFTGISDSSSDPGSKKSMSDEAMEMYDIVDALEGVLCNETEPLLLTVRKSPDLDLDSALVDDSGGGSDSGETRADTGEIGGKGACVVMIDCVCEGMSLILSSEE